MSPTRPVSERFLRAIRGSHPMTTRARIVAPGQTGVDPTGTEIGVIDGAVELDAAADVRSTLDLTTPGRGMWPDRTNTVLAPYGAEIHVARGVGFGGGTFELVSLGYFRVDSLEQDNPPDGPIRITASDRMVGIVEAQLTAPRRYTAAQSVGAVVDDLVLDVYPWATVEFDDATDLRTIGRDLLVESDRHAALKELVTSYGKVMWWDHRGVLVIKSPPDPAQPVYDVTAGRDGVLVTATRELSRDGVFNAVVATGESFDADAAVRAVVVDNNPNSPTWWFGDFGKVPHFHSSPLIADEAQARDAAAVLLRQMLGLPYRVGFGTVPNAALEPLDPVRVSYSDRTGRETHVIQTLTVPLTAAAAMNGTTREKTIVVVSSL